MHIYRRKAVFGRKYRKNSVSGELNAISGPIQRTLDIAATIRTACTLSSVLTHRKRQPPETAETVQLGLIKTTSLDTQVLGTRPIVSIAFVCVCVCLCSCVNKCKLQCIRNDSSDLSQHRNFFKFISCRLRVIFLWQKTQKNWDRHFGRWPSVCANRVGVCAPLMRAGHFDGDKRECSNTAAL